MTDVNNMGFEFMDFIITSEEEIFNFQPTAGSYAIVNCANKYLIGYNTLRNQWELPAGKREQNETPKECAIRELYEETGQVVKDLEFKGLIKVKNIRTCTIKYNPVFYTKCEHLQPFKENDETSEIKLWDLKEEIGFIDSVDINIFRYL